MRGKMTAAAALTLVAGVASATVYTDTTGTAVAPGIGDMAPFASGFTHLDIAQVEVTNDATWLTFAITVVGDLDVTSWGKYVVGIDSGLNLGDNTTGPAWNRNVDWGRGITDLLATWADDGGTGVGGEFRQFDGTAWSLTDATYLAGTSITGNDAGHAAGIQQVSVRFADLGLVLGDTLDFDVFSTGGSGGDFANGIFGDPGVDHLSASGPSTTDWANQSVAGTFLSYTLVPAPSSIALLGLGGLAAVRRRR